MPVTKFSEKKYGTKEFKRKLEFDEYVFEIDGNDISDVDITYSFDYIESTVYKDGEKSGVILDSVITIELSGKDKNDNEAWICFDMKGDINYFNSWTKVPTDISHLLLESESFIKRPLEQFSEFLDFNLFKNSEDDIYKKITTLWISKIKENEFIIKLCVPGEVFTYFKICFEKDL